MADGRVTIEAFIKRFREQPPAPPEERYIPDNVEFWWHNSKKNREDGAEISSPLSSRSNDSGRRERYGRKLGYNDSEDEDNENDYGRTQFSDSGLFDFEKRTENLMMKCDEMLTENNPPTSDDFKKAKPGGPLQPTLNLAASEEFPPWISLDVPTVKPSVPSPRQSSSSPHNEDRNSPDSIDDHLQQSLEQKPEEHSERQSIVDTESDVSDLEDASVETTNELIKRAEQLLHGFFVSQPGDESSSLHGKGSLDVDSSLLSTDALLIPSSPIDIPTPEVLPTRPELPTNPVAEVPVAHVDVHETHIGFPGGNDISSLRAEVGVQTEFPAIDTQLNSSLISSTTSLFISPSSTPRGSPLPLHLEDSTVNFSLNNCVSIDNESSGDPPVDDPKTLTPSNPLHVAQSPIPNVPSGPLPSNFSQNFLKLTYEDVEPFLRDETVSKLWNRLVIVREQMKRLKKYSK